MVDILSHDPFKSRKGLLQNTFNHLSQVFACTKYDYPRVEDDVTNDPKMEEGIEEAIRQQCDEANCFTDEYGTKLRKSNEKRAANLLHGMRSTLSHFLLR